MARRGLSVLAGAGPSCPTPFSLVRRPKPLLAGPNAGVDARSGPVQRAAGALAEGAQAICRLVAEIGEAVGHVVANILSPVIGGRAAGNRAQKESEHGSPPAE